MYRTSVKCPAVMGRVALLFSVEARELSDMVLSLIAVSTALAITTALWQ